MENPRSGVGAAADGGFLLAVLVLATLRVPGPVSARMVSHDIMHRAACSGGPAPTDLDRPDFVYYYSCAVLCGRLVTFLLIAAVLLTAGSVQAGPILASAMRHAEEITLEAAVAQPTDCQVTAHDGATDARQRQGRAIWVAGGVIMPIIMPVLAHIITPQPPADALLAYSVDDARCYAASYSETAKRKRKTSAWIGSAAGFGLAVTLIVAFPGTSR